MKQFSKTHLSKAVVAAALVMSAGTAGATIRSVSDDYPTSAINEGALNEAFLSVYDPIQHKTFELDLGTSWLAINAYKANANPGLSYNLTTLGEDNGANWNTFKSGITNPNAVKYVVVASDRTHEISITGNAAFNSAGRSFVNGDTVGFLAASALGRTDEYDNQVSTGDLSTDPNNLNSSNLFLDSASPFHGQHEGDPANQYGLNLGSVGVWGGWDDPAVSGNEGAPLVRFDPNGIYGSAVAFQWGHDRSWESTPLNANQFGTYAATWTLAGNTLTFGTVSAVPLPAAVWMFGAGLMGILRLNRRKGLAI